MIIFICMIIFIFGHFWTFLDICLGSLGRPRTRFGVFFKKMPYHNYFFKKTSLLIYNLL